ncbi:RNA polymerase sigma factor [Vitiosangium sp. GDMCC 1.1324]|uniref:RNA polymerase sigma factor n=1 Tax=Vitiosangium sp. (strain GDMCC 1.1324) TaxID=2138576 RepID=UPI000D353E22|nr:RNA polymerase sigma factor [Vitiosangium sp. GDMCC 1.1324]PTL76703.1 RNA polymerase sigma factor [Vitiosangium sp. GDMCC 1.1324]
MTRTFAGDSQGFAAIIGPHWSLLHGLARKLCRNGGVEPEDLVQDTLERALHHFERLRGWSHSTQRAWLCTTLHRRFLDHCRHQRTEAAEGPRLELLRVPVLVREPRRWQTWEHVSEEELHEAIARLRHPLRAAFELHTAGLRYRAIAERLGTTPGTVGFWLHQARRELRAWLQPLAVERAEELAA